MIGECGREEPEAEAEEEEMEQCGGGGETLHG